jgi:hypothetical protein
MSTATASPTQQQIAEAYAALKIHCDNQAARYKDQQILVWVLAWASTTLIVALCILSLAHWVFPDEWHPFLLAYVMPTASLFGTVVTLYQQFRAPRSRWLKYRAATERLREHAMLYMLCRFPYDDADNRARFLAFLHRVRQEADRRTAFPHLPRQPPSESEKHKPGTVSIVFWRTLTALGHRDPGMGQDEFDHPPDRTLEVPVWTTGESLVEQNKKATQMVQDRLRNQYHWHLNKCAQYFRYYMAFQFAYMTVLLAAGLYASLVRRDFAMTALTTLGSLIVIAFSEFMAYGTISLRYYQLAQSLQHIHETYFGRKPDPNRSVTLRLTGRLNTTHSHEEQRQMIDRMTDELERTLSSEFRFWQLVHDTGTPPATDHVT